MTDAISTATQGMLAAEKRAGKLAKSIVEDLSQPDSFSMNAETVHQGAPRPNNDAPMKQPIHNGDTAAGFSGLIQHMADLKETELVHAANAKLFVKLADMEKETSKILDDRG